jgi:hypothetical protein
VIADELVAFESSGDLEFGFGGFGAEDLADAAEVYRLRTLVIEGDDVFDGTTEIGFTFRGEQDAAGADIPCESVECNSFRAGACNCERKLKLEAPGSSLFHKCI